MFRVEVLFKNAQIILINFDSSKAAFNFLGQVASQPSGMTIVSTHSEETVLNLSEVAYARIVKDSDFVAQQKMEDQAKEQKTRKEFESMEIDDELKAMKNNLNK